MPLTLNWWGLRFFHPLSRPRRQKFGHHLQILVRINIHHFAPLHTDHMNAVIVIRRTIRESIGARPTNDDGCIVWQPLNPHIMYRQLQPLTHSPQSFKPPSQTFDVVTLSAQRVSPPKR